MQNTLTVHYSVYSVLLKIESYMNPLFATYLHNHVSNLNIHSAIYYDGNENNIYHPPFTNVRRMG